MKKGKYIVLAIPVIIILILVAVITISKKEEEVIYCDPIAPRGNDLAKWNETITTKEQISQVDSDFFDKIKISSDANEISIEYPTSGFPDDPFPFEVREITYDKPIEIGEGTLRFYGSGVAFCDANHISGQDVQFNFFDSMFQPINSDNINEFGVYEASQRDGNFQYNPGPFIQFCFEYQGIEDVMFNGIKVFDAQTRKLLSSGYSSSGSRTKEWSGYQYKVNVPIWHKTPIDVVIDVSFGPSKTFEFKPQTGEGFIHEGFECRLVSILDDIDIMRSSHSSYENKSVIRIFKSSSNERGSNFIFACYPTADKMPITFDFFDKDGNNLPGRGTSTSGYIQQNRLGQPLEKVGMIQAKYRTNKYRIIVHLPYIPGLPEQNNNIDNLFDVYIPYVKLNNIGQLNSFLYETLQLRRVSTIGPKPSNSLQSSSFPIIFTELTIRDIVKIYAPESKINTNIEKEILEINYPLPLLTRLKMLFFRAKLKQLINLI